jgi:hypothetical protein
VAPIKGRFAIMRGHAQAMTSVWIIAASCTAMAEQKRTSAQASERSGLSHHTAPPMAR